jgi:hypothetical protein
MTSNVWPVQFAGTPEKKTFDGCFHNISQRTNDLFGQELGEAGK